MENLKEKYYEKLKKEIKETGYVDAELETYYVDDIKSEYLTAINTTDEDDLENLANEFNEYIEKKFLKISYFCLRIINGLNKC